ncbi:MAG: lysophospholipid acyltransferase family protein [Acetobacteraceae bacterium]
MMTLLRSGLFNLYFFALTFVLCLVGTGVRFIAPAHILVIPRFWARSLLAGARVICGIRYTVTGLGFLPADGPLLIASRHQSTFDTLVWLTLLPRCCYVLKQELTRIPLFGGMIRPAGQIVVDRAAGASALRHLVRDAERAVRERRQIVIFPEGTRGAPGHPLPLQPGVAAVATRTRLPVIPVVTDSGLYWGRRAFRKRAGTIQINIQPPILSSRGRESLMTGLAAAFAAGSASDVDNSVG